MSIRGTLGVIASLVVKPRISERRPSGAGTISLLAQGIAGIAMCSLAVATGWGGTVTTPGLAFLLILVLGICGEVLVVEDADRVTTFSDLFLITAFVVLPVEWGVGYLGAILVVAALMSPAWYSAFNYACSIAFSASMALLVAAGASTMLASFAGSAFFGVLVVAGGYLALRAGEILSLIIGGIVHARADTSLSRRIRGSFRETSEYLPDMGEITLAQAPLTLVAVLLAPSYLWVTTMLVMPFVIAWRSQQHRAHLDEARKRARADVLTGLYNRAGFFDHAIDALLMAERAGMPVSLIMGDLDNFKRVNDTLGHQAGDEVLASTGDAVLTVIDAEQHVCGRYGGEELAILCVGLDRDETHQIAETLRREVEDRLFTRFDTSISLGIAYLEPGDHIETLVGRADKALYSAKYAGKNRVHEYPDSAAAPAAVDRLREAA